MYNAFTALKIELLFISDIMNWYCIRKQLIIFFPFDLGYVEASMRTCLFLRDYEDIIDPCDIYSLLGMAYKHIKSTSNLSAILAAHAVFCHLSGMNVTNMT